MPIERSLARQAAPPARKPQVSAPGPVPRPAVAPTSAQLLQRRLGNQGTAAFVASQAPATKDKEEEQRVKARDSMPAARASSLSVSSPNDPAEREASTLAARVVRMPAPVPPLERIPPRAAGLHRSVAPLGIQRRSDGPSTADPRVTADIQSNMSGGTPLSAPVRTFMEPRFRADFGNVRVHTSDRAAALNQQVNARAFTVGQHVFFGKGAYQPDSHDGKELIAHELTHTIQQGAAVQRSEQPSVTHHAVPHIQRWGFGDALDFVADKANVIPGFRMFTIILGVNPINMAPVARSAANILRALIEIMPGGGLITQALDNSGIFDKVGAWVEQQIKTLGMVGSAIKQALTDFLGTLKWSDVVHLDDVWARAKRIFTEPIERLYNFAKGLVSAIVQFVKDAILMPLAKLAEGTRGWDLLIAVLGKNPITGVAVPRTAETLIPGFLKLIGQEEVWENMKKSHAIPRAWAWFQGALAGLMGFVAQIPTLAVNAFKSLELIDIVLLPKAFAKVAAVFGNFIGNFITWAGNAVWTLLELIFEVVSPAALKYIKKTGAALKSILKNPLPFVGNLVKAAKLGFQNFGARFGAHLKAGLIDWLTGSLPGVYIPKAFELGEIVKFVFSVLGISWQNVRQKLVKVVGEPAVKAMETGFDIVVTLVTQGPAAAWDKIKEQLTSLKDMVIGGITDFVVDMVVQKAIPKLIAMFIPGAGFISAIISIYDTIMVFVNKISQIIQVVTGFIDSIVAIAGGAIAAAATKVENILAGLLSLAINFLAGFLGLGKVADKIMGVIQKVRAVVDKGIDALINWIVTMAKKLGRFVAQAGVPADPNERLRLGLSAGAAAVNALRGPIVTASLITPILTAIKVRYGLAVLQPVDSGGGWWLEAEINPKSRVATEKKSATSEKIPAAMTVAQAVGAIRAGSKQVTVRTEAEGRQVVSQAFPQALERPGASIGSAYGSGDVARLIQQFRVDRQQLIVFHVDTKKYKVDDILPAIRAEIAGKETAIQRSQEAISYLTNEMIARQSRHTGANPPGARQDFVERIASLNAQIDQLRGHIRNLQEAERSFQRNLPEYRKLEAENVLYGHESVMAPLPHRTEPHINIEGTTTMRVRGETLEKVSIDVTIYLAGA